MLRSGAAQGHIVITTKVRQCVQCRELNTVETAWDMIGESPLWWVRKDYDDTMPGQAIRKVADKVSFRREVKPGCSALQSFVYFFC